MYILMGQSWPRKNFPPELIKSTQSSGRLWIALPHWKRGCTTTTTVCATYSNTHSWTEGSHHQTCACAFGVKTPQVVTKQTGGFSSLNHTPAQPGAQGMSSESTERTNSSLDHEMPFLCHPWWCDMALLFVGLTLDMFWGQVGSLNGSTKPKTLPRHCELNLAACQLPLVLMRTWNFSKL